MRFRRLSILFVVFLISLASIGNLLSTTDVLAVPTGCPGSPNAGPPSPGTLGPADQIVFTDAVDLTFLGKDFTDINPYDSNHTYRANSKDSNNNYVNHAGDCVDYIEFSNFGSNSISARYTPNGGCNNAKTVSANIDKVNGFSNRFVTGYLRDANNIFLPVGGKDPGCNSSRSDSIDRKADFYKHTNQQGIFNAVGDTANASIHVEYSGHGDSAKLHVESVGNCQGSIEDFNIKLANNGTPGASVPPVYGSAQPPGSGVSGPAGATKATCESTGTSLSWIMCPIINGLADASDQIYSSVIQPLWRHRLLM